MELSVTIDDPKVYTKPFEWLTKSKYKWAPKQDLPEDICVPSVSIDYMNSLAKPAGTGDPTP
jgi:hypothetical protein